MRYFWFSWILCLTIVGCSTSKLESFTDRNWQLDTFNGGIVDANAQMRFSFEEDIPKDVLIIGDSLTMEAYPGLRDYLSCVIKETDLQVDSLLFYLPYAGVIVAKISEKQMPPASMTIQMGFDEEFYTGWIHDDDVEKWQRRKDEMYTNIVSNKKAKRLIAFDRFSYGSDDIAMIYVLQTDNKKLLEMNLPKWTFLKDDITKVKNAEQVGQFLDSRRNNSILNYRNGLVAAMPQSGYIHLISKADSCYMAGQHKEACDYFEQAFVMQQFVLPSHLSNAAANYALCNRSDKAFHLLFQRLAKDSQWHYDIEKDNDFASLHSDDRWETLLDSLDNRREKIEANFDKPLKTKLENIARSDQEIRYKYIFEVGKSEKDTVKIAELLERMRKIDAENLAAITSILDSCGWVGKERVGDASAAFWLILQHSDLETQKKYLPAMQEAVGKGDLDASLVAMTEDRICVWEGKKQKYGTQIVDGKLAPLMDETRVDEWRKSVGLEPLDDYLLRMKATR